MTVTVGFASLMAQVVPVFLLMLLFERLYFGRVEARDRGRVVLTGHLVRYLAVMGCFLVFALSLVIVFFDIPMGGLIAWTYVVTIALLVVLLWGALIGTLDASYRDSAEQLEHPDPRGEQDDDDQNR